MVSPEILANHYAEYAAQPDKWVANMATTKRSIIKHVLETAGERVFAAPVRVVVLGASDKRYTPIHKKIFGDLLGQEIDLKTFDLDIAHLGGGEDVAAHDVTKPFPASPYDIVFSHELMKFLTPDEQLQTLKNSYDALSVGGIAMHIMHEPSIKGTKELRPWQNRVNPDDLLKKLKEEGIAAEKLVFESESNVGWLRETTVLLIERPRVS